MSDHSLALVPIESWSYASPELKKDGRSVDIGLLAEALLYYDRIAFNVANEIQFTETIRWFWDCHHYPDLLALLSEGTLQFYEYAFKSTPIGRGKFTVANIQTLIEAEPNSFEQRFLDHPSLGEFLTHNFRDQLNKAFQGRVIEVKAKEYGLAINNALEDFQTPERAALLMQTLLNELWRLNGLGKPPQVRAEVHDFFQDGKPGVGINFYPPPDKLFRQAGIQLDDLDERFLFCMAAIQCNRFLWSSAQLGCDLFMPSPMGSLVGDKLDECGKTLIRNQNIIDSLQSEVEFPDIRQLVNNDQLSFRDVLKIRKKAVRFRNWLQAEGDRDRNAIIAYHHEIEEELGMATAVRKTLKLFGILGPPFIGTVVGTTIPHEFGTAIGGSVGAGVAFLTDMAAKIGEGWKPIVFGNWLREKTSEVKQR